MSYGRDLRMPETACQEVRPMTISERLKTRKENLEKELAGVNETIALFEKNPGTQQVLDALAKLNLNF